jgi:hypothetical protein
MRERVQRGAIQEESLLRADGSEPGSDPGTGSGPESGAGSVERTDDDFADDGEGEGLSPQALARLRATQLSLRAEEEAELNMAILMSLRTGLGPIAGDDGNCVNSISSALIFVFY